MYDSRQSIEGLLERSSRRLAELHVRSQDLHEQGAGSRHQDSLRQAHETLGKAMGAFAASDLPRAEDHLMQVTIHLDTAERLLKSMG
jgi:hypothetical protein